MPDPSLALELSHVDKRYGRKVHALKDLSLNVRRGEIFGLLGPNGAGKSTLVKILMTVIRPTRAEGFILGQPVTSKAVLQHVGYLPENHRFPRYLTGRQTLEFFSALSGTPRAERRRRIGELLEIVGMGPWADSKVGQYSKGMMQRVGIAQALSGNPDLIVLDEPTDGVDPVGRRDIRDLLLRLKSEGKTVFINSHLLSELELVSDHLAIMVGGQVAKQGTLQDLAVSRRSYEIETEPDASRPDLPSAAQTLGITLEAISTAPPTLNYSSPKGPPAPAFATAKGTLPDGRWVESTGLTLRIGETEPANVQPLIDALRAAGHTIRRVQLVQPTLEQLFMEAVTQVSGSDKYIAGARIN